MVDVRPHTRRSLEDLLEAGLASLRASFPSPKGPNVNCEERDCCKEGHLNELVVMSVPCLSLQHDDDDGIGSEDHDSGDSRDGEAHRRHHHHHHHHHHKSDRKQVEEYASLLLARPLAVGRGGASAASFRLLENVADSFGTLVDSRLRAYATFLARHGVALARRFKSNAAGEQASGAPSSSSSIPDILSLEGKVKSLLLMGESVRASLVTVEFRTEEGNEWGAEQGDEGGSSELTVKRSVSVQVAMQVDMTLPASFAAKGGGASDPRRVTLRPVRMHARGLANVARPSKGLSSTDTSPPFSVDSARIDIQLDTRQLLSSMIHQASDVVAAIVERANTSSILAESRLCRSSSYLAMPPPPTRQGERPTDDASGAVEEGTSRPPIPRRSESFLMLSKDVGDVEEDRASIVSPEAKAVVADAARRVPFLSLDRSGGGGNEREEDDEYFFHDLSPEACETIVDGIFGSAITATTTGSSDDSISIHVGDEVETGGTILTCHEEPPCKKSRLLVHGEVASGPGGATTVLGVGPSRVAALATLQT